MSEVVSRAEGAKRLIKLAQFLEKLPKEEFNYAAWIRVAYPKRIKDADKAYELWLKKRSLPPRHSCGTTACALGWATKIPELKKAGLRMDNGTPVISRGDYTERGTDAGAFVFGITEEESGFLFRPCESYNDEYSPESNATPKQVAKHIRKFVKTHMEGAK